MTPLLLLFLFLLFPSTVPQCLPTHRNALLALKSAFSSPNPFLASWGTSSDCCSWNGVNCTAGKVTDLDLSGFNLSGAIHSSLFVLSSLKSLNLSLNRFNSTPIPDGFERLRRLTFLNLSTSGFAGPVPVGISRLFNLETLDLSSPYAPLQPITLETPDLRALVNGLRRLRVLCLDNVNVSAGQFDWSKALSESLPELEVLSLRACGLTGPLDSSLSKLRSLRELRLDDNGLNSELPEFLGEISTLRVLRLSKCDLNGSVPESIFELRELETLDLSLNPALSGNLPAAIGSLAFLKILKLGNCSLSGLIPASVGDLVNVVQFDLSNNGFSGPIPEFWSAASLKEISLPQNNLNGSIPASLGRLRSLTKIDLQNNLLSGAVDPSLFRLPLLQILQLNNNTLSGQLPSLSSPLLENVDLSNNKLQGPVPESVFKLSSLRILNLASNNFSGKVNLNLLQNLQNLSNIDLSRNKLTVESSESNGVFPMLGTMKFVYCSMTKFPHFLKNQNKTYYLDLSGNSIGGAIPSWIWNVGNSALTYLNLSHNSLTHFEGPLPDFSLGSLAVIDLGSNNLKGPILLPPLQNSVVDYSNNSFSSVIPPNISARLNFTIFFSLSKNNLSGSLPLLICNSSFLQVLDLSNNKLSGPIPSCIGGMKSLYILNLRNNSFTGTMPSIFSGGCKLKTVNLNDNELKGPLPKSLSNCAELEVLDVGNNHMNGQFPSWLRKLVGLRVLVLRSNEFEGSLECKTSQNNSFSMLQIIDLSSNKFSGNLSLHCFRNWKAMMLSDKNVTHPPLGHNYLVLSNLYYQDSIMVRSKGLDTTLVKILTIFTSIDFSNNRFEGRIPEVLGDLNALYVLNISHNNLTGPIPPSFGNLSQLETLDLSRNMLSGEIPMQLTFLYFLSSLNLSYNRLTGRIPRPQTGQFALFTYSSFMGNPGLCGLPLSVVCSTSRNEYFPSSKDVFAPNWLFILAGLGFGGGVALVMGPLMTSRKTRKLFNKHVDKMLEAILPREVWLCLKCCDGKVDDDDDMDDNLLDMIVDGPRLPFCVHCTRLEFISGKVVIKHIECSCSREG